MTLAGIILILALFVLVHLIKHRRILLFGFVASYVYHRRKVRR